jgi:putative hydrolase of the HAD superfamily
MSPPPEPELDAVVFDLDGVIRHWNDDELAEVEESFGLQAGEILAVAFAEDLGRAAITGRLTYREWMDTIRERVIGAHGAEVAPALDTWEANVGLVDPDMVFLLRRLRERLPVALLSNGTTRLRRDLHVLDLLDEFDVVFNTAEIGIAKPDEEVFRHVCSELAVDPRRAAFVDDLQVNVDGAASVGMHSHRHTDRRSTEAFLLPLAELDGPGS